MTWDRELVNRWHPIARSEEVCLSHIFHSRLLDQELAVWRDSKGGVNVWENRCPHRGARLTIGTNLGSELRCQYHGLRFATGSGQCVSIPAHPGQNVAQHISAKSYGHCEKYGLVWGSLGAVQREPSIPALDGPQTTTVRSMIVREAAPRLAEALKDYSFIPSMEMGHTDVKADCAVTVLDACTLTCTAHCGSAREIIVLIIQPAAVEKSIVHGVLAGALDERARASALRHHNERLCTVRDAVEHG